MWANLDTVRRIHDVEEEIEVRSIHRAYALAQACSQVKFSVYLFWNDPAYRSQPELIAEALKVPSIGPWKPEVVIKEAVAERVLKPADVRYLYKGSSWLQKLVGGNLAKMNLVSSW